MTINLNDNSYPLNIDQNMLKVDESYQRKIKPNEIRKIVEEFDMNKFNPPKVSHRADGYFYIFDGQHSAVAYKQVFGDQVPIRCRVYEGLSYKDEVNYFTAQNGTSSKPTINDFLRANNNLDDSDTRAMFDAVRLVGFEITFSKAGWRNHICATEATYHIWKKLGKDNFINVMDVIKKSWDGESLSLSSGFIKGLGYVYEKCGSAIENKKMVDALKRHTPDWYVRNAADMKGSLALRYATLFVDAYNYGKRINRLPDLRGVR